MAPRNKTRDNQCPQTLTVELVSEDLSFRAMYLRGICLQKLMNLMTWGLRILQNFVGQNSFEGNIGFVRKQEPIGHSTNTL